MKKLILLSALVAGVTSAKAVDMPFFQASLTPDIAVQSKTTETSGLTLNVWGESQHHGCTLGFVNGSTGQSSGFTWGFFVNYDESYKGFALGMVNVSKDFHGLQWGFVNYTENLRGVQLGLVNIAKNNPWFNEFPDKLATGFPFVNWSF